MKKTQKELEADLEKTITDLETPEPPPSPPAPSTPAPSEPAPSEPVPSEPAPSTPPPESPPEPTPSKPAPSEPAPSEPEENPEKKKLVASQREALILKARNDQFTEAMDEIEAMPEPTEEELKAAYKDWDVMDDIQRSIVKENYKNKKALAKLTQLNKTAKDIKAWNKTVDEFCDKPETITNYPELANRVDDFKIFASKPTRRGVPFDDLIAAFMYERSKTKKKNNGSQFPRPSGGPNLKPKPKSDKISVEESMRLKQTNYPLYLEKVRAGKVDMSDLQ